MLRLNEVYHADALHLLRKMQVEGVFVDAVISDPMYGVSGVVYDMLRDQGDPDAHWAYHEPIYEACLDVLRPGGVLAWAQAAKWRSRFTAWFGDHRQWIVARHNITGRPAHCNLWVVQTREREAVRPPDTDMYVERGELSLLKGWHPNPKPVEELELMVQHLSQPGDVVVDMFCGLGSTLRACQKLGRLYLGCDLSPKYTRLAKWLLAKDRRAVGP